MTANKVAVLICRLAEVLHLVLLRLAHLPVGEVEVAVLEQAAAAQEDAQVVADNLTHFQSIFLDRIGSQ